MPVRDWRKALGNLQTRLVALAPIGADFQDLATIIVKAINVAIDAQSIWVSAPEGCFIAKVQITS